MKTRLSRTLVLAAFCTAAPALWAGTASYFKENDGNPTTTPGFHVGFENPTNTSLAPVQSLRMGYEAVTGGASPFGLGSFDLRHADGAMWEWNWDNGTTKSTVMELSQDGIIRLSAPPLTGGHIRTLQLDPSGKITFGPQVASGTIFALQSNGTDLLLEKTVGAVVTSSPILTVTAANSLYLTSAAANGLYFQTNANRLQLGTDSTAQSNFAIAMGSGVRANGQGAVALGASNYDVATAQLPEYEHFAVGKGATALGYSSQALFDGATSIGWHSRTFARSGVAIGEENVVYFDANSGVAIGYGNRVEGRYGVALGESCGVSGRAGVGIGHGNWVVADFSFAGGKGNQTRGVGSVALGNENKAFGEYCTVIGSQNNAYVSGAFAAGAGNLADGVCAVALGSNTQAIGWGSFTAGWNSHVSADFATALGYYTEASGQASTAIGAGTQATGPNQLVIGSYNTPIYNPGEGSNNPALIVGNGTATIVGGVPTAIARSNALVVRWNGNVEPAGNLTAAGTIRANATTGTNVFKAPVLVPKSGDIDMGEFTAGTNPADL
jgi:hypothetical protein